MNYASVCSGIEAATVAWHDLGWRPQWFSEIEKFPSAVLKYRFPDVPNLGDMKKLQSIKIYSNEPIDLLVGGTPCQAFSIAGLRKGLDDVRSNLALKYCRILIRKQPRWFVWENVPGVFSSNGGKDFEAILTAFRECGYSVAWRILDAQYFGVPQRRRRVFVVGYFGSDWRPPVAVLFERESLRRDFTPRREKGKEITSKVRAGFDVAGTIGSSGAGTERSARNCNEVDFLVCEESKWPKDICSTIETSFGPKMGLDNQHINSGAPLFIEHFTIDCRNDKVNEEISGTIQAKASGSYSLNYINPILCFIGQNSAARTMAVGELAPTIECDKVSSVVYDTTQITSKVNRSNPTNEICHTIAKDSDAPLLIKSIARRLTPLEVCRLQGFPDNHCAIPGAKDSPQYSAYGNSMAVPVMKWIGTRIDMVDKMIKLI